MQSIIPHLQQTPRPARIGRNMPIKQAPQALPHHKPRLQLHRLRRIIAHKAAVTADTKRRAGLLITALLRAGPRQILVIKHAVLAATPGVRLARLAAGQERAAVRGDAEEEFLRVHALVQHVGDGGLRGGRRFGGAVQLRVVAGRVCPGAGKVVGHYVEEVEVSLGFGEVDVSQRPFARGEAGCEDVFWRWEHVAKAREEVDVVCAFRWVGRVFPVD